MREVLKKHTYVSREGEKNSLPSMTVPDQALPLKKILADYTRGVMPPNMKQPEYHDDYVPDLAGMDLSELAEYAMEIKNKHRQAIEDHEKQKLKKEKEAVRQEILAEMQKAENQEGTQTSTTSP